MEVEDLTHTIKPKSDQLNADDLLTSPLTVTVANVAAGDRDQPVSIAIPPHQPYKPCLSMRRVLITAWGENGKHWVGKSMVLYCDTTVKFGGVAVGGIRISHLSDITRDMSMMLTATRGRKKVYKVRRLVPGQDTDAPMGEEKITAEQEDNLRSAAMESGADEKRFLSWLGVETYGSIPDAEYGRAMSALNAKREKK